MILEKILDEKVKHLDIKKHDVSGLVSAMAEMSFQARNLARAADIYEQMLKDPSCCIILTLAGSLFSSGLKQIVIDLIESHMIDVIVSTGANIVDQDFFEALGFSHYKGSPSMDDEDLRRNQIDRIYDTLISEDDLRRCDDTIKEIADRIGSGVLSSREFVSVMGRYLADGHAKQNSIVEAAYHHKLPIFVPAFSDCSAGFGLVAHQWEQSQKHVAIDSVKDFRELTKLKIHCGRTGLFMIGGGVPKNFVQDTVVAAEILGHEAEMHKYAIQITVADERDGALSGSTLKEAHSWGKVDKSTEQMVFCEATIALPLIASYAYHRNFRELRPNKSLSNLFEPARV